MRATVKELIKQWETGGLVAVKIYLNEAEVFNDTWISKIKNLLDKGHFTSVEKEIQLVSFNLDLKNKLYTKKNGHPKDSGSNQ